uniref:Putative glycosyltransferase n=1 Tax=viral metagenome TaxID=1070528 RepID=A0A6M3L0H7_9ZZZZ
MKVCSFRANIELPMQGGGKRQLRMKEFYVLEERFFSEIQMVFGANIIESELPFEQQIVGKSYNGQDLNNKTMFCFRSAGIGDLMAMMLPIRKLKELFPSSRMIVGADDIYRDLIQPDPSVSEFVPKPYELKHILSSDYVVFFQGLVENFSQKSTTLNIYDLFFDALGFPYNEIDPSEKIPKIYINEEVDYDIEMTFEGLGLKSGSPVIGLQFYTSTVVRDYPPELFRELVSKLSLQGIRTVIIGERSVSDKIDQLGICDEKSSFNFAKHCLTLNHLFSIINHCTVLIGPDTSGLHIAGALGIPMIGLFGPIPSNLRIEYFKKAVGIDGKTTCSPCFRHGNKPCRYSVERGLSPCMHLPDPDLIVKTLCNEILPSIGVGGYEIPIPRQQISPIDEKRLVVTLAIGDDAEKMLDVARDSMVGYAKKVDADFLVIDKEIVSGKFVNIEKFQMRELLDNYDRILYLDVDILVHPDCPDLFLIVPIDYVAAVPDSHDAKWGNLNRFSEIVSSQKALGNVGWNSGYFNSGVLIFSKKHVGLFDDPHARERFDSQFRDQSVLNYNLQKHKYKFMPLERVFNGMEINGFSSRSVPPNKTDAHILHFAHEDPKIDNMKKIAKILIGDHDG